MARAFRVVGTHFLVNALCESAQFQLGGRNPTEDGDDQWTQAATDLYAQCAAAGVDRIVKMRREEDMAMLCGNIIKTCELQLFVPPYISS